MPKLAAAPKYSTKQKKVGTHGFLDKTIIALLVGTNNVSCLILCFTELIIKLEFASVRVEDGCGAFDREQVREGWLGVRLDLDFGLLLVSRRQP
jgi:hypothetical protein